MALADNKKFKNTVKYFTCALSFISGLANVDFISKKHGILWKNAFRYIKQYSKLKYVV